MKNCIFLITVLFIIVGCTKKEPKIIKGNYYFDFDEVVYYNTTDMEKSYDYDKKNITPIDSITIQIMRGDMPTSLNDSISIAYLDSIGFNRKVLPVSKNKEIKEVFREKKVDSYEVTACAWTYRDIYILKKNGKITGIVKLCYDCGQYEFIGTNANTDGFGTYGEFYQLRQLVK